LLRCGLGFADIKFLFNLSEPDRIIHVCTHRGWEGASNQRTHCRAAVFIRHLSLSSYGRAFCKSRLSNCNTEPFS
jgi:hypothetical protein